MTYEEAINVLKHNKPTSDSRLCGKELCDAVDIAIEALEKQIPKKPSLIHANIFHCGNKECDAHFTKVRDEHELFKYCPFCGQAIDWSEE